MTLESTEKECAANAVAPRVSLSDIEAAIGARYDMHGDDVVGSTHSISKMDAAALRLLSVCILHLKNGFIIIGKSAPASPDNFNAELGKRLAYEDAIRQLWPMMGFALKEKLAA